MSAKTLKEFLAETGDTESNQPWELENERILEVKLYNQRVWMKAGGMVAYRGAMKFEREGAFEHGASRFFKEFLTGEGAKLTKCTGSGRLYLAEGGKRITLIKLDGDSITVNGSDLLAFEDGIQWDIRMTRKLSGMVAGGLFNLQLQGKGLVAITTHGRPLTLRVKPDSSVYTDPNATVAWSSNLEPEFKTDISFKTLIGRTSGESVQMAFKGDGFVVVQPYEEQPFQAKR
ncbi:MAG: AIM24 family protein [Ahniella sp.]|nr:AIM24 family protein [Ahniella sp.]